MLHVGLPEIRTLPNDFAPALTLYCRRTYADDINSHPNNREKPQGEDLRQDPRCLYIGLDLTACQPLQLDRF